LAVIYTLQGCAVQATPLEVIITSWSAEKVRNGVRLDR